MELLSRATFQFFESIGHGAEVSFQIEIRLLKITIKLKINRNELHFRNPRLDITWIDTHPIQPLHHPYYSPYRRYSRQSAQQQLKNKSADSLSSESEEDYENVSKRVNPHRHNHHQQHANASHKRHIKKNNEYLHREHNKDLSREMLSKTRYSSENFRVDENT